MVKVARRYALRSREAILVAAATRFSENANATYGELGVRSGLNPATVYRHFPDRVLLFAAVFEDTLQHFEEMVAPGKCCCGPIKEVDAAP